MPGINRLPDGRYAVAAPEQALAVTVVSRACVDALRNPASAPVLSAAKTAVLEVTAKANQGKLEKPGLESLGTSLASVISTSSSQCLPSQGVALQEAASLLNSWRVTHGAVTEAFARKEESSSRAHVAWEDWKRKKGSVDQAEADLKKAQQTSAQFNKVGAMRLKQLLPAVLNEIRSIESLSKDISVQS